MPFRRREQPRRIVFEAIDDPDDDLLVAPPGHLAAPRPDDAAHPRADAADADGEPGQEPPGPAAAEPATTDRKRRLRLLVPGLAAALALVLGGLTLLDTARAREAEALLRLTPGGVVGLEDPPREAWRIDFEEAMSTVVGELVLVMGDEALVAYDLSTGAEKWRREDLASHQCGSVRAGIVAAEAQSITCLGWGESATFADFPTTPPVTATVLGLDGATLVERELDPARGNAANLADGNVVRAYWDGSEVVVLTEDARTGAALWTLTVPRRSPELTTACDSEMADPTSLAAFDAEGSIAVYGCDVNASISRDGVLLSAGAVGYAQDLGGGRFVSTEMGGSSDALDSLRSDVLDSQGKVLWSADGEIIRPLATDGTAPPLLFSRNGSGIVALDEKGEQTWRFPHYALQVLLVTEEVTVISSYPGAVAVDTTTGEKLWTWKDTGVGGSYGSAAAVAFAGRGTLTIAFGADVSAQSRWVSIDVLDGRTRWDEQVEVDPYEVFTRDGRLYSGGYTGFVALT